MQKFDTSASFSVKAEPSQSFDTSTSFSVKAEPSRSFDYQFIIIGGGAAGFAAAIKADALKIKTLMISGGKVPLGGTCINVGCMPSKRLLTVAEAYWNAKHSKFDGVESRVENIDFEKIIASKDALISKLQGKQYAGTLKFLVYVTLKEGDPVPEQARYGAGPVPEQARYGAGPVPEIASPRTMRKLRYGASQSRYPGSRAKLTTGHSRAGAKFIDKHTIEINGEKITGEKFLISTGSSTFIPPIPGLTDVPYLTNIEALSLKELPKSMIILGGGPLGLEFAQIYNRFGTKVTILQSADRIADREEPELTDFLKKKLEAEGITVYTSAKTKSVKQNSNVVSATTEVSGKELIIEAEKILVAAGVRANTGLLNLEAAGVKLGEKGGIVVNDLMQSSTPHIHAAGDVVDQSAGEVNPKLETVAGREGFVAASNLLENKGIKMDFRSAPHAIFTDPPLAGVGLTDAQIVKQTGLACFCRTLSLDLVPKAHILEAADGFIKMAIDSKTEEVVGIHMVGARADEIISVASFIIKNRMKLDDIIENTFIFPTMAESIKWVAQSFRKDVTKLSCCTE